MNFAGNIGDMSDYLSPKANLGLVGANSMLQNSATRANSLLNDAREEEAQIRANYLRESSAAQADLASQLDSINGNANNITTALNFAGSLAGAAGKKFGPGFGLFGGGGNGFSDAGATAIGLGSTSSSNFSGPFSDAGATSIGSIAGGNFGKYDNYFG